MYRLLLIAAVMAAACGDNKATPGEDAGIDAPAGPSPRSACLDRPTDLSTAPTGQLPCELLPPGFTDPTGGAPPPREVIMATQPLRPLELVEGIMHGGPGDRAVIHLEAPTATLDWNIHGHANGGTQNVAEALHKMTVDYVYVPSATADWWLLLRNGGATNMDVNVTVELYGDMTWRWQ